MAPIKEISAVTTDRGIIIMFLLRRASLPSEKGRPLALRFVFFLDLFLFFSESVFGACLRRSLKGYWASEIDPEVREKSNEKFYSPKYRSIISCIYQVSRQETFSLLGMK